MIDLGEFRSMVDLVHSFPTEESARERLAMCRWGGDVVCPYCGRHHCGRSGSRYVCPGCGNKFSVLVGTIFQNTKVSLRKWFMAIYLISKHKKGISSCQLSKDIRVTQKTAWYMLMKIRTLFVQKKARFRGVCELDEVYIGGREYLKHKSRKKFSTQGRSLKAKVPIFGILRRGWQSTVRAFVVSDTQRSTLMNITVQTCELGSTLYTDEFSAYQKLSEIGYDHQVVPHGLDCYINGPVHTNSIEGFWAHLKRMVYTYHRITRHHIQSYVDEAVFRWNNRSTSSLKLFRKLMARSLQVVPYKMIKSSCI